MNIRLLLLIAVTHITACLSANGALPSTTAYLTTADKSRLKKILESGLISDDVATLYYSSVGFQFLGETLPNQQKFSEHLIKSLKAKDNVTIEEAYYGLYVAKVGGFYDQLPAPLLAKFKQMFSSAIEKDGSTMMELYSAVSGLNAMSEKLSRDDVDKVAKAVQSMLRKDDNLLNLGCAFHIAPHLGANGAFAFDHIEDAIVQADEVDGKYLQFEGGVYGTGFLVNGIFKLSNTLKKKPPLKSQQIVKLANYLLSRRSVQTPKGSMALLSALTILAGNDFDKPICVTLASEGVSISAQQPMVTVKVCDILGNPVNGMSKVIANTVTRVGDDAAVLSNQNLQPSPTDKTLFTMNLMEAKPERGFYKISVTAGPVTNTVTVKVLCEVVVDHLEIGTGDADQTTQPKLTRVVYPEKLKPRIEADSQQKLVMRFLLKDGINKKPMRAHQAFVRLSSAIESKDGGKVGREIIFVAEPDTSHLYKFDMPVGSAGANFDHQSGDYNVELIVGDAILTNPFQWTVATVNLKFPDPTSSVPSSSSSSSSSTSASSSTSTSSVDKTVPYKRKSNIYATKPEIQHMFREPEKRPPAFVSNLFTGLCLAPVLLLFILWAKLGVNISNFPLSLSAVTFHLGLGSIFLLFGVFWLQLNMFVTLRYLLGLGVVTFLAGNKMLSRIAHKHKLR
ncbi:oligosaccharide transferase delta subunit [Lasioglossum baleicum]|uniref:oligosaccharide transferase delta subunit n=1 Tax=Lasioglossum baleicum TaxID=434251 RepID=UPI003FCC8F11